MAIRVSFVTLASVRTMTNGSGSVTPRRSTKIVGERPAAMRSLTSDGRMLINETDRLCDRSYPPKRCHRSLINGPPNVTAKPTLSMFGSGVPGRKLTGLAARPDGLYQKLA